MLPNPTDTTMSAAAALQKQAAVQYEEETLQEILLDWGAQLECWARNVPLLFAIVAVTVCFAVVITVMPPAFQTNDDAVMCMIVSGQGLTLEPDEHLVFTNVIIGKILKALYIHFPGFLWYGWYLVTTQWIVTVALLYCFLRPRFTWLRLFGFAAYFLTAGIYFLVNLQFTSTANMAGIAGGMLLLQLVGHTPQRHSQKRGGALYAIAGAACLLLVWAGLIRSDALLLAVLLICPLLIVAYWLGTASRSAAVGVCLSLGCALGLMFFAERYHQECYSEPKWQAFYEYNQLRVKFNDEQWVKYTRDSKHIFDQVGWSKNDFEMIANWFFDDQLFDQNNLSSIVNGYPWMVDRNLWKTISSTLKDIYRHRTIRAICLMLPALLMFLDWRQRRHWPCLVSALTAGGLLMVIVVLRKAPPERVFMPILAFPWLVLLSSLAPCWRGGETRRRTLARIFLRTISSWQIQNWSWWKPRSRQYMALRSMSFLLVMGFSISITKQIRIGNSHHSDQIQYDQMLQDLRPAEDKPERLVLTFGGDFPYEHQAVLLGGNDYSGLHFYCIGWPQRTPFAERMKQHYNIKTIGQALAEKPDMLVIVNSGAYGRIMEYLADHYNSALRIVNLKKYDRGSLSMIEPNYNTVDFEMWDTPILLANPHLELKGKRR